MLVARMVARMAGAASRVGGRGGTSLPGKVLLALRPDGIARMAERVDARQTVLVSATNGKTTMCAMFSAACEQAGRSIEHNMAGANLRSGIATTLLGAGRRSPDVLLLETDEATLPLVAPDLRPTVIVLGNLFRDQLDRYGELEMLADRWQATFDALDPRGVSIAYNVDDPLLATLVADWSVSVVRAGGPEPSVLGFGIGDASAAAEELPHAADSRFCRRCMSPLEWSASFVGHLGHWRCSAGDAARPVPGVVATAVDLEGLAGSRITLALGDGGSDDQADGDDEVSVRLRIPGLYNAYNALGAAAAGRLVGLSAAEVRDGLAGFSPAFGRFERIPVPGTGTITLLLVKNPTGLNEVVRTLASSGVDMAACLFALNDGIADGRDTSWVWDADIEPLLEVARSGMVVTGDRAAEFALRAAYGGAHPDSLLVIEDIEDAMYALLERARQLTPHGHAYALVTYTAMLRMRRIISERGWAEAYWARRGEAGRPVAGSRQ